MNKNTINIKDIYDTVTLQTPCSHNEFLTHFDQTVRTLIANYRAQYVVLRGRIYAKPRTVNEDVPVHEEYFAPIVNNILYLLTADGDRKTDFVAEADAAYRSVWAEKAKRKRILDRGYYNV